MRSSLAKILLLAPILIFLTAPAKVQDFDPADPKLITNLEVLCKTWGFLKYHHPKIAQGSIDWDEVLIQAIPVVMKSESVAERNSIITNWLETLGPVEKGENKALVLSDSVLQLPDLSWIDRSDLGDNIRQSLLAVRSAKRSSRHHYLKKDSLTSIPVFTNENAYRDMTFPDRELQLLCLFRYWNAINYFFPYKKLIGSDWEKVLTEFIPKFIDADSELSYKLAIQELVSRLNDSHAVVLPDKTLTKYFGERLVPLELTSIAEGFVVTGFLNDEKDLADQIKIGDVIEAVDGKTVQELIASHSRYTSASNRASLLRDIAFNLLRTNKETLEIKYKRNGSTTTKVFPTVVMDSVNPYQRIFKRDTCFRVISPNIAYLNAATLKAQYVKQLMPLIMKKGGLIIDFRCYPSDMFAYALGEYLVPGPTEFVQFSECSITTPGAFVVRHKNKIGRTNAQPGELYRGKIIILVNEFTQSSAEFQTMALRISPNAEIIGNTTAGADGNITQLALPGGVYSVFSGIGVYNPDGTDTQRVGIKPTLRVVPTLNGIRIKKDEIFDEAIGRVNTKK